jgi:hypothetical protein
MAMRAEELFFPLTHHSNTTIGAEALVHNYNEMDLRQWWRLLT